ncbi:MAG TPA: glycolate oxidase subunit GlcE [Gammaproteobacteria bacterium]|nr:glycolate oxidase subunit GlcE [Gammaproteobacteria bacterium]
MLAADQAEQILSHVQTAAETRTTLNIQAGESKNFYGRHTDAEVLDVSAHQGIINYQPSELVITARAGTLLSDINSALKKHHQMLAFEPPGFSDAATLGGTIACNLSGPRRAYSGAARDYVLGCTLINGQAEKIHFGGEVMKNVAGYDVSRLMCGAMGTLGVLLDISLKVVPEPEAEITLVQQCDIKQALHNLHHWANSNIAVSASCYDGENLYYRLSGNTSAIQAGRKITGGDEQDISIDFWHPLKEQQHSFFNSDVPLWRLSLGSSTEALPLQGDTLIEWGGALRWLKSNESAESIRRELESHGGQATLFRHHTAQTDPFHKLSPGLLSIHKQLKKAFDPLNIFNPGRMYPGL